MLYITCGFLPTSIANIVQTSERIPSLLEYFTASAAYFRVSKSNQFFTTNAQRGIYFFIYNVIRDTVFWIFFVSSRNYCTENIGNNVIVDPELLNLETFVISSEPTVDARRG